MTGDGRRGRRSPLRADARDASVVVRAELRAQLRRVAGDSRQLVGIGVTVLMFGGFFPLVALDQTLAFGAALASGEPPVGRVAAAIAAVATVGAYFGGATGLNQSRVGDVGPLLRASVAPRAVALGRIVSEGLQGSAVAAPAFLAFLVVIGVGAGGPGVPALLVVAGLAPFAVAFLFGRLVGVGLRAGYDLLDVSVWTKAALLLVGTGAVFVGIQRATTSLLPEDGSGAPSIGAVLPGRPVQAYADLAVAPLGGQPEALGVLVTGALLVAFPVALWAALLVETARLVGGGGEGASDREAEGGSRGVPAVLDRTLGTRIAWRHLLRTRRDPKTLSHLLPLVFGVFGFAGSAVGDPEMLLTMAPGFGVVGGAALAGGAYCLNPLGDDRDQLPLLLTSVRSVAPLLRGRAIGGAVLGLVLLVPSAAGSAVHYSPGFAVALVPFSLALFAAAAGTALGLGALVPKFERSEYMNVERAHPSTLITIAFFFGCLLFGGGGTLLLATTLDGGPGLATGVGWIVYAAVVAASGALGYVYAVRKFDRLTLDAV